MADMIKFYKGLEASLPASGVNGALYITTDEGAIYLGTGTGMKRLGDFVQVANVAALPEKAHENCLYYCVAENILAKWNGTEWKQVNKQPTTEELKTLLGLGTLAYKSEVAEGDLNANLAAKINAASGAQHSHDNKDVIDGITADKVTAWDAAEQNAKDYADDLDDAMNTRVEALEAIDHEHANAAELAKIADGDKAKWDAASEKAHTHTFNETELNKIVDGDVAKWNAVAADHLDSEDETALKNLIKEAKQAGTDANTNIETYKVANDARVKAVEDDIAEIVDGTDGILAQAKAYSDGKLDAAKTAISAEIDADVKVVADDLAGYKTSNDTALAGVKATAEAAATKVYTDEELAKKVNKTDYESDKATFATKTELGDVDDKFANYRTSADQDVIDNGHKERIEALEAKFTGDNSVDAKIAAAVKVEEDARKEAVKGVQGEVDAVEGRMDTAEGKITALEGASATHATKDELKAVDAKFADYTKTADLPTDLGDFTNNAGYAKNADVNTELDKKADKTQVATDIANAIAPLATTEALNGVKAIAEAATTVEEVDAQIDAKITALNLADTYEPIGAETRAKAYADGLITDANLGQYTTEQEVKDIVDGVIAGAADSETYNSLTKLVDYIDTHGGEAAEMAQAIETLEGDVKGLKEAPSASIKASDIEAWNGEIGAKALAETKTTAAEVKTQIEAYGYATTTELAAEQSAREAKDTELATAIEDAKTAASNQDAVILAEAQGYADQAEADAIAAAKTETENQVKALADTLYTKDEVDAAVSAAVETAQTWGEF